MIGEPYVYSYYSQNFTQLSDAVHRALETPIGRHIPSDMTTDFALQQIKLYLARDLEGMFNVIVQKNGGEVPKLIANVKERCTKIGRCKQPLPAGKVPAKSVLGL